jgi:hypothetical protein
VKHWHVAVKDQNRRLGAFSTTRKGAEIEAEIERGIGGPERDPVVLECQDDDCYRPKVKQTA